MGKNVKQVKITVPSEQILKRLNSISTFNRLSRLKLKVGENIEMVNHKFDLEEFFRIASLELSLNPICDECSDFIPAKIYRLKNNVWVEVDNYRNCVAHILFKSKFHSVSCNHNNRLFLCAKNGCHERSHRLDTFSQMKIFPTAVMKFRLFENEIKESNKFLHAFREYANKIN